MLKLFVKNKKAISPVVATALLLVVAVVSVVGFQGWFNQFSSSTFVEVEQETSLSDNNVQIESLVKNTLYVNSNKNNNSLNSIQLNGIDCNLNTSLIKGINKINISSCIQNISEESVNVLISIGSKLIEKYVINSNLETSTPTPPVVLTPQITSIYNYTHNCGANVMGFGINGNRLYIPCTTPKIIDISTIGAFSELSDGSAVVPRPDGIDFAISGNYGFSSEDGKLRVYDVSSDTFSFVTEIPYSVSTFRNLNEMIIDGNYLYTSDYNEVKVYSFDISNPLSPVLVSNFTSPQIDWPEQIRLINGYLVFNHFNNNNKVFIDISNPTNLSQAGFLTSAGGGWGSAMTITDNNLFTCDSGGTIEVFDISNKASPSSLGSNSLTDSGSSECIIAENYLIKAGSNGIGIYDISNPNNVLESTYLPISLAEVDNIKYHNNYLYVVGNTQVKVFDLFAE